MKHIYMLWAEADYGRFIVGVFLSEKDAMDGWSRYCKSGQWHRDIGTVRPPSDFDRSVEVREIGHVNTTPYVGDDGEFG